MAFCPAFHLTYSIHLDPSDVSRVGPHSCELRLYLWVVGCVGGQKSRRQWKDLSS